MEKPVLSTDIPHTPADFQEYLTPYSCIYGWPRSFRRLPCSSVRFNTKAYWSKYWNAPVP